MPYTRQLSEKSKEKARKELNEKEEWLDRDIETFREMILSNKGLKCRTDSPFLMRFLRARKFDYEKAYELLVTYIKLRQQHPEILSNFNIEEVRECLDTLMFAVSPHRDSEGRIVGIARIGRWDPEEVSMAKLFKMSIMLMEYLIEDEETQVNGIVFVEEYTGFTMKHAKHYDIATAKMGTALMQDGFPMRFKGLHVVNEPTIFGSVFAIVKPFIKSKTMARIHFHGHDRESLHKILSPKVLPQEFGGELGPMDDMARDFNKKLEAASALFESLEGFSLEEVKDISKKSADLGPDSVVGTFRKLNVD